MIESIGKLLRNLSQYEDKESILETWAYSIIDRCASLADEWENSGELSEAIKTEIKQQIK